MFSRGAYSYVPVGGSGEDYDLMARNVGGRVFFAGEATNRKHPVTVAGAYLSGVREACAIHDAYMDGKL
jgi:lysine-specific histone demethylase 1